MIGALLASIFAVTCPPDASLEKRPTAPCLVASGQLLTPELPFAPNRWTLTARGVETVRAIARALNRYTQPVEIRVHLDAPERYSIRLSQRRADAIQNALVEFGVAPARLIAKGYGDGQPIFDPRVPARNRLNRRVEFWLRPDR